MEYRVTVVVDNCVPLGNDAPLRGELGLALLVEGGGRRFLLDTGQSSVVTHNLNLLGLSPESLDAIILSHGHFDHSGGLRDVLQNAHRRVPVYLHDTAFAVRHSVSHGTEHFVGIPYRREQIEGWGGDLHCIRDPLQLLPNLWLSGSVPRQTSFETGDTHLVIAGPDGSMIQDAVDDDIALFVRLGDDLIVISGCTHSGLVNMVRHGLAVTGAQRLRGWIGGTHLGPASAEQQRQTLDELEKLAPKFIATSHCTGFAMMTRLQERFGDRFTPAFVGTTIEF